MSENIAFPPALIGGATPGFAFREIQKRLKAAFSETRFTHCVIPPRPTKTQWTDLVRSAPMVGVAWSAWTPEPNVGGVFRGDLSFEIVLMTKQNRSDAQYFGDGVLPGILGMVSLAIFALHDFTLPGADCGTCRITHAAAAQDMDWVTEDYVTAGLILTLPKVGFGSDMLADLDDFLRLGEIWTADDGASSPQGILKVRGGQ